MEEKVLIKRNGTEYYRKKREVKYNKTISFRYEEEKLDKYKQLSDKKGIKYQTLMKQVLNNYLESEVK